MIINLSNPILEFRGEYYFLSNFYQCSIHIPGLPIFPSAEHCYQWYKTEDSHWRDVILQSINPGQAKRMGRKAPLRTDWENVKDGIMRITVLSKFSYNHILKNKLLNTGLRNLIEGNTWGDTYWGVCNGVGKNMLGKILMETRQLLRGGESNGDNG